MNKEDREVYDAIKKKFGSAKLWDEKFSDRDYWSGVPVDDEGVAHEIPRSNPDVLPESEGMFYKAALHGQYADYIDAYNAVQLTGQERSILQLLSNGYTLAEAGDKIHLTKNAAYSALKRVRQKILAQLKKS